MSFKTKYRVSRDRIISNRWAVQYRLWWWPVWIEHGNGLLDTQQEAEDLIDLLLKVRMA